MALGITWNFAKPTEFSNLNTKMNATNAAAAGLGTIIGRVHDAVLDEKLAQMLEGQDTSKARMSEIDKRIAEIDAEIESLQNQGAFDSNAAVSQPEIFYSPNRLPEGV